MLEDRVVPAAYFVSTNGVDGATGATTQPWRTLQYAADHVHAGDTVTVRAGDYTGFDLFTSGTVTSRITFTGEAGARVTTQNHRTPDGINLEGASYVTVQGFTVTGVPRAGIRAVEDTGVVIQNNTADANGVWGIFTGFSENVTIQGNVTSRSGQQHGIYVSNSANNPVIRGNVSWGNNACGIHMNGDASMGGDGIISNALVENNVLYSNGAAGGSSINADGVQNSIFRNNLIYDAKAAGISLFQIDGGGGSSNNQVVNNTILVNSSGRWALSISDGSTGNVVRNNILYSSQSFRGALSVAADSLAGLVSDYNLTEDRYSTDGGDTALSLVQWRAATGQDAHSLTTADPNTVFVNAASGDYHLKAGSAALDRGTTVGAPATDAEGTTRPQGAGVDIGHDELAVSPPPPASPPPPPASPPPPPPPAGTLQLSAPTYTVGENGGFFIVTATRVGGSFGSLSANYGTSNGTATGGLDYTAASGTLTWANGDTSAKTFTVQILDDSLVEGNETVNLSLTSSALGTPSTAVLTITDNDTLPPTSPASPPPPPAVIGQPFAVGTSGGTVGTVTMYNPDHTVRFTATPFGTSYTGGVKVAVGDVTGDGVADVVAVAEGNGQTPARVAVVNGSSHVLSTPSLLPSTYTGQVSVSVGDVNKDGVADIALGTNEGGPQARVFRGGDFVKFADFRVQGGSGFSGRTEVAVGDVTGDGYADLMVAARYGNVTRVFGYSGNTLVPGQSPAAFTSFTLTGAYGSGVYLSVGDLNGDGYADLVFGSYAGSQPGVKVYSGKPLSQSNALLTLASFTPTGASSSTGVKVAMRDVNGDGRMDLLTSSGELVNAYSGTRLGLSLRPPVLFSFDPDPNAPGGVSIG